jgi:hypothetical protein
MTKPVKYWIIGLSVLAAGGIGYIVYQQIKISKLNKKVSTLGEAYSGIDALDTNGIVIPSDASDVPDLPLYDNNGADDITTPDTTDTTTDTSSPYPYNTGYTPTDPYTA